MLVAGHFSDVVEVQNDDEFSDYDGECKSHDACESLRIVDSKHCVNSDTLLFLHKPGQMILLGSRLSVVSCILDLNSAEQAVYAFSVSSAIYLAQEYDWHFSNMHRPGDGNQELQLWFRKAGEALH